MDKHKLIISLLKAIFTVVMIISYKVLFGPSNVCIGLMVAFSAISFLKLDFTLYPVYRSTVFIILSLFLLIMSLIAGLNPFIGLIINIFTLFIVSYIYMKDSKSMISYLFLFIYIYMVSTPITIDLIPKRLLSLLFGIFIIILGQFLFNKNKFKTSSSVIIIDGLYTIKEEIQNVLYHSSNYDKTSKIDTDIRKLLNLINEQNSSITFSTILLKSYFNIAVILERLPIVINKVATSTNIKDRDEFLKDLNIEISSIINILLKKKCTTCTNFSFKHKDLLDKLDYAKECTELIKILYSNISALNNPLTRMKINLKDVFENTRDFKRNSIGFNFSIKVAIAVSLSLFFVHIFNIRNGNWIVITIYVLLQPFSSDTIIKTKKRVKGTVLGVILSIIIFGVFHSHIPESLLLIPVLFFYFYATDYYIKVIFTCILSLSLNLSTGTLEYLSIGRFSFIIIGCVIALLFNKYFMPYDSALHTISLKEKYLKLSNAMTEELSNIINGTSDENTLIKLALDCNSIESKLLLTANNSNDSSLKEILDTEYTTISSIRFCILNIYSSKLERSLS
ncbi:MAG: FUSC family protein [Clostridium sp.]|uniref:FUSC family protein n=1 Tax=Clostridium sp. TaxID=1506 RepID=UPI003F2CDAAE